MAKRKYTWIVKFEVDPLWVADGFTLSDERAHEMLARALGGAHNDELGATVLFAPPVGLVLRQQGYEPNTPNWLRAAINLAKGTLSFSPTRTKGGLFNTLLRARSLIDSVAYVQKEGDKEPVLKAIDDVLKHFQQPARAAKVD